jgi:CspA family cold shock protein
MSSNKEIAISSDRLSGRVKWFNNKAGYGFVTVTDGVRSGSDIFVHHSAINVENQQYKYLVQGEYIEFDLMKTESSKHEWQAARVSGIKGGKLMCETRNEVKNSRNNYRNESTNSERPISEKPRSTPRPRPRPSKVDDSQEKKEWTLVGGSEKKEPKKREPKKREPSTK